jgi:predicted nucleic acid-binding protein
MCDTSVFIDHFRSKNKNNTYFDRLLADSDEFLVSAIAKYEVLCGAKEDDIDYWGMIFGNMEVLPFDDTVIDMARQIHRQLKRDRCLIDMADILIAATAIVNDLPLATLNRNHFGRIDGLRFVDQLTPSEPRP